MFISTSLKLPINPKNLLNLDIHEPSVPTNTKLPSELEYWTNMGWTWAYIPQKK